MLHWPHHCETSIERTQSYNAQRGTETKALVVLDLHRIRKAMWRPMFQRRTAWDEAVRSQ